MAQITINEDLKKSLLQFLQKNKKADLITTYLTYLQHKYEIHPMLFVREKTIYRSKEEILKKLEDQGKLWRETEVTIQIGEPSVNEDTKKIYICPFTGKVFGDNTHPNPQDAIYDWVAKCPENKERIGGLKSKRFFVSDDPDFIKNYIQKRKAAITKTVFSSALTGKLFNTKKAVIDDFVKNQIKPIALPEVPQQNRFQIEDTFLCFIEEQLKEEQINAFVEALNEIEEFSPHIERWLQDFNEE